MTESTPDAGERSDDGSNNSSRTPSNQAMNGFESKAATPLPASTATMEGSQSPMNGNHVPPKVAHSTTALEFKKRGNGFFAKEDWKEALKAYRCGLEALQKERQARKENEKNILETQSASISPTSITQPIPESGTSKADLLEVALRSNVSFVLLRLHLYDQAEAECSHILLISPTNSKALYRRASAREGLYFSVHNHAQTENGVTNHNDDPRKEPKDRMMLVREAIDDLKRALLYIEEELANEAEKQQSLADASNKNAAKRNSTSSLKKQCKKSLKRLQNEIHRQERRQRESIQKEIQSQQKRDVLRLLLARHINGKVFPGEAFFLIEWNWWVRWCRYVGFFDDATNGAKKGADIQKSASTDELPERTRRLLGYFPTGATFPSSYREDPDDDMEEDDSSDSSDDEGSLPMAVPGRIDNSKLLFDPDDVFFKQWYQQSNTSANNDIGNDNGSSDSTTCSLRPNLIRGYHYEILPREVYCALRTWYSETTPSICQRVSENGTLNIYRAKPGNLERFDSDIERCSACRAPEAYHRCERCMEVQYCDESCQEAHYKIHKNYCRPAYSAPAYIRRGFGEPRSLWPRITLPSEPGLVGLSNLGNTCFMNSALQALSHATPLTRHFLSGRFRSDLNKKNPLGTGGKLALAYRTLLQDIWMRQGSSAVAPVALKRAIAQFAPRFANYQQHDSQEFLAYLLDGLHEDINRIRKAPYVEMPDVTDGQNMTIAGADAWNAHKKRNDSMVMDTFYGQFQSTCVCPKCNRVSVSFDAFNHVSLEIPSNRPKLVTMSIPVLVHFADGSRKPIQYGVKVRKNGTVFDLKSAVSNASQIVPERLILTEVHENNVYISKDNKSLFMMNPTSIVAYEVTPTTAPDTVHFLVTHSFESEENGQNTNEDPDSWEAVFKDAANTDDEGEELIGLPFMTSIGAKNSTCRDLWELLCGFTERMVVTNDRNYPNTNDSKSDDSMDITNGYRLEDILTVHIEEYQPRSTLEERNGDGTTKILPHESEDLLSKVLGEDCTGRYVSLRLVWKQPTENGEISKISIDPDKMLDFDRHSTFDDIMREKQISSQANMDNRVTLHQCFQSFSTPERLDTDNMWYCSKCQEHVQALKTMKLWRLPNILVVHLKRFEYKNVLRRDKLSTFVDFPISGLDMNPHCANLQQFNSSFVDNKVPADYDLFAVVNHYGRLGFGHYTADAMQWDETGISNSWNTFNDAFVRTVSPSQIVSPNAYILFYRRRTFH